MATWGLRAGVLDDLVGVADDGELRPLTVKVGDRVLFGKYAGTEIKVSGEDRLILREDDILGIIED